MAVKKKKKASTKRVLNPLVLVFLLIAILVGSFVFIGVKLIDTNKALIVVDEESKVRDNDLQGQIDDLEEGQDLLKRRVNGLEIKIKTDNEALRAEIDQLKKTLPPPPIAEEKNSRSKKKGKKFSFEDLENIGEQFEEMFN